MEQSSLLVIADICQGLVVFLSLFAYVPQWVLCIKQGSSEALSLRAWGLWLASGLLAWFYALVQYLSFGSGLILLITSGATVAFILATIALIIYYRYPSYFTLSSKRAVLQTALTIE